MRHEIRKWLAVDQAYTNRTLHAFAGFELKRARNRRRRLPITKFEQADSGVATHRDKIGEYVGNVGDNRFGAAIAEHERAGAATTANQTLPLQFAERAAHGNPRDPVLRRQRLLTGKGAAVLQTAVRDAIAQQKINLARF